MTNKNSLKRLMSFSNSDTTSLDAENLDSIYGKGAYKYKSLNDKNTFVFSQSKPFDLIELEQLLQSVGWSRRPIRRVKKALDNSLLKVGVWRHDPKFPRLVGFARCTGDGFLEVTIWDVAIHPVYQGFGLGKQLMTYVLSQLKKMKISKATLFADAGVLEFYKSQGWVLEPKGKKCAFWYAN